MGRTSAGRRPVAEGVLHDAGDGDAGSYLVAGRCPTCALVLFPRFWICPRCLDRERPPEPLRLSGRATLERSCVAERGPKAFDPPYVQGFVRLDEGPVVYALVRGVAPERPGLTRGRPMRLSVETVRRDDDGTEVVGWVARPAAEEEA